MLVNIKVTGGLNIKWGQIDPKVTGGLRLYLVWCSSTADTGCYPNCLLFINTFTALLYQESVERFKHSVQLKSSPDKPSSSWIHFQPQSELRRKKCKAFSGARTVGGRLRAHLIFWFTYICSRAGGSRIDQRVWWTVNTLSVTSLVLSLGRSCSNHDINSSTNGKTPLQEIMLLSGCRTAARREHTGPSQEQWDKNNGNIN